MPTALITGTTGFLGTELTRRIIDHDDETALVALIRAGDDVMLRRRHELLTGTLPLGKRDRVSAIRGDLTQPRLGCSPAAYAEVLDRVDRVVHVAATTRFDHSLEEARRHNVGGTAHVLALCRALHARGKAARLDYVSTAYVAGDRLDVAGEDDLDVGQGFRNTYERSKLEAEQLCRAAARDLPVAIYRPSIVMGDSSTGVTTSYATVYGPMKLMVHFYGLLPSILPSLVPLPLNPECSLDIVPVDFVAQAVVTLYHRPEAVGRCYHLAAGAEGAATIEQLATLGSNHLGAPRLRYVHSQALRSLFARVAPALLRPVSPRAARQLKLFLPYTIQNPRFDTANTRSAGLEPPPVAAYFARLVAYAYATDFGRRRPSAEDGDSVRWPPRAVTWADGDDGQASAAVDLTRTAPAYSRRRVQ